VISPPGDGRAPRWPEAEERGWYRRDRVYIFWSDEGVPIGDHIGRFEFATEKSYLYDVEPIGDLETDPAGGGHDSWQCCVSARVLSFRLWLVVRSLPYEFAPRHKPTAADDHRGPLHNPGDSRDAAADHRSSNWDLFDVIPVERDYRRLPGAGRC
jgi:hypothetical protein